MIRHEGTLYRPPSEADSLILQATIGCSYNECTFCAMYREKRFRVRKLDELRAEIAWARDNIDGVRKVFLADGDALMAKSAFLGALLDELRIQDWLPRPWRARLERHKRVIEELRSRHGREPREDEIAAALELPLEEYSLYFGRGGPLSTPSLGHGDAADGALIDVVADTHSDAPGERLTREELLALVAQRLSPQEYRIVYLKYWEELPMREIGELEGLSESRVCKIHTHLLERLQERFHVGTSTE